MLDLKKELATAIAKDNYEVTNDGIYFPRQGVAASGDYIDRINGGEWNVTKNLIVTEGLIHILNVALGSTAKPAGYYLALFSASATPTADWTAASFSATASEIVSMTEGYTAATRPQWKPSNATTTAAIDNMAQVASVTIATASTLTVQGAAMLTSSAKGGTTGALISATKYPSARVFQNGDIFEIGYRLSLTV